MKQRRLHLFMGEELFERIDKAAEKRGVSASQMAVKLLESVDWTSVISGSTSPTYFELLKKEVEQFAAESNIGTEFTLSRFFQKLEIPVGYRSRTGVIFYRAAIANEISNVKSAERLKGGSTVYEVEK